MLRNEINAILTILIRLTIKNVYFAQFALPLSPNYENYEENTICNHSGGGTDSLP